MTIVTWLDPESASPARASQSRSATLQPTLSTPHTQYIRPYQRYHHGHEQSAIVLEELHVCRSTFDPGDEANKRDRAAVLPGFARMSQSVKEQFGQVDDKVCTEFSLATIGVTGRLGMSKRTGCQEVHQASLPLRLWQCQRIRVEVM